MKRVLVLAAASVLTQSSAIAGDGQDHHGPRAVPVIVKNSAERPVPIYAGTAPAHGKAVLTVPTGSFNSRVLVYVNSGDRTILFPGLSSVVTAPCDAPDRPIVGVYFIQAAGTPLTDGLPSFLTASPAVYRPVPAAAPLCRFAAEFSGALALGPGEQLGFELVLVSPLVAPSLTALIWASGYTLP